MTHIDKEESDYRRLVSNSYELRYEPHQAEGQCILQSIVPVKFILWRFILDTFLNTFLLIPLLLTYWKDKYKRIFYMQSCELSEATHLYVVNYDEEASITKKEIKQLWFSETDNKEYICFVNRYMTYLIGDDLVVRLNAYDYRERIKLIGNNKQEETGLNEELASRLMNTFGPGTMVIHRPTLLQLAITEIMRPLYAFLIFSILYWIFIADYMVYAVTLLIVFLIGVIVNLYQMVEVNNKIFKMAFYEVDVKVLRSGVVKRISSFAVVPGDIVFLKDPIKIPFKGIIIEGSALINECALTGQSVPVVKKADRMDKMTDKPEQIDKNAFVFEGTTIIQVSDKKPMLKFQQYRQAYGIPICVVKTNFNTTKGQLVRIILFPKEQENKFQKQSAKFLIFLFTIAVIAYIPIIVINYQYESTADIVIKFIDLIITTVPPALPVSMTFGIIYALDRLNKKKIFCIAQNKVIVGGIIDFCCFDKTGTLTEDHIDFHCVVASYAGKFHTQVANTEEMSKYIIDNIKIKPYYLPVLNNMAANHSIIKVQTTNQLIGDPMEIKAFQFGQFTLNHSSHDHDSIFSFSSDRGHFGTVYRRYEFDSQLQRMSVIARSSFTEGFYVYTKGSPEAMQAIIKPSSIPPNYNEVLKEYASHGFRVLSIASKTIPDEHLNEWERDRIEQQLVFNGFQIFQNPLKPQSKEAILQLKRAKIDCVMITGDNTLTGSNISYKCSISNNTKDMIIIDYVNSRFTEQTFSFHDYNNAKLFTNDRPMAESYIEEDMQKSLLSKEKSSSRMESSFKQPSQQGSGFEPNKDSSEEYMFNMKVKAEETNCQLCITGRAFNEVFSGSVKSVSEIQEKFLEKVSVFARTKPNDKAKIVMTYQAIGKKVAMCGDGANDCGALKQADIGLSLSQAEASISAPFTSQTTNITSMVQLIKECRAGLATNFSLFNIMAIYSLIQFSTEVITDFYLQFPSGYQYLYWDICSNFVLILFIGFTATSDKLSISKPKSTLFSLTNILQMVVMFLLQFGGQISTILLFKQTDPSYYQQNGGLDVSRRNFEVTQQFSPNGVEDNAIFIFVNNVYLFSVLAFNISDPWRKEVYINIPLMGLALLVFSYNTILTLIPSTRLAVFSLDHMPNQNHLALVIYLGGLGFSLFLYVNQKYILEPLSQKLIYKHPKTTWL